MTQVQKLELDWPPRIRDFFSMLNILSLSFSSLSPRCVVHDWHYLDRVPIMNAAPPVVFLFLLAYQFFIPRIHYRLCMWGQLMRRRARSLKRTEAEEPDDAIQNSDGSWFSFLSRRDSFTNLDSYFIRALSRRGAADHQPAGNPSAPLWRRFLKVSTTATAKTKLCIRGGP